MERWGGGGVIFFNCFIIGTVGTIVVMESLGAWDSEAFKAFSQVASRLAVCGHCGDAL